MFQVTADNPLVGLDGRVPLLRRLGEVLAAQAGVFGAHGQARRPVRQPYDARARHRRPAHDLLAQLLTRWRRSGRPATRLVPSQLGDCWRHDAVPGPGLTAGWLPFHKLSQWLTYSLIEPFEWAGVRSPGSTP